MIGKHITKKPKTRSSFAALNRYITDETKRQPGEKIAYTGCLNLTSVETATLEMESLAFLNKRCKDPVMHLLLSWRENENPTEEQAIKAVQITLDELNLSQCQAVYSLHQNTHNLHLHICVNRIDPETHKAITPAGGWTRRGMERVARRVEYVQGWQVADNTWSEFNESGDLVRKPIDRDAAKIPQKVKDMENITGEQSAIRMAQDALKNAVKSMSNWDELHKFMAVNDMSYQKKGSGAVIHVGEIVVKVRDLHRAKSEHVERAWRSEEHRGRGSRCIDRQKPRQRLGAVIERLTYLLIPCEVGDGKHITSSLSAFRHVRVFAAPGFPDRVL
jgi:hypothetical protein